MFVFARGLATDARHHLFFNDVVTDFEVGVDKIKLTVDTYYAGPERDYTVTRSEVGSSIDVIDDNGNAKIVWANHEENFLDADRKAAGRELDGIHPDYGYRIHGTIVLEGITPDQIDPGDFILG